MDQNRILGKGLLFINQAFKKKTIFIIMIILNQTKIFIPGWNWCPFSALVI